MMVERFEEHLVKDHEAISSLSPQYTQHGGYTLRTRFAVHPGGTLLRIPKESLLNVESECIRNVYPSSLFESLTSIQILTIHMSRMGLGDGSFTDHEQQYLSTLPDDFTFHPLYWTNERLQRLPEQAQKLIHDVQRRYTEDLLAFEGMYEVLKKTRLITVSLVEYHDKFKWAWLIVNTRCLYYPIKGAEKESQLSLCPYLDLLNHSSPTPNTDNLFNSLPKPEIPMREGGYEIINNSDRTIEQDEEITFMYGPHSDDFLLAEYGFALGWQLNAFTEVNITSEVTALVKEDWKRIELEQNGSWGDYTLHLYPSPAWPSQRTLMALRLVCLDDSDASAWREMVNYQVEIVSEENESRARGALAEICQNIARVSREMMQRNKDDSLVCTLWESTYATATQVEDSIKRNVSF
ncbi:hypothetical protein E3P99_00196 [Wallemia hederae]|uniref:Uncharacterized protein n=1 Tax=Wallemia hederae TaxID=1540922 RepID=A0A4T0G1R5_9BASI|nr:hypothetical protein E3P99_00196 [Wallemia hederae]